MMTNKKVANKKKPTKPSLPPDSFRSESTALSLIEELLNSVQSKIEVIERNNYLRRNLPKFAYQLHLYNVQDFFHGMLASKALKCQFPSDQEPHSISLDSLSHVNTEKVQTKSVVETIKQSRVSTVARTESKAVSQYTSKKQRSVKLKLEPIEESKFVGQLRQKKVEEEGEESRKIKEEQEERKKLERRQAYQSLKISYDYNGEILHTVDKTQNNLVQKMLQLKLKKQRIVKKKADEPQPESVSDLKQKGYKKKDREKKMKKEPQFMQFLDSQSLADSIQINRGIKYSHNSLVFQQKKRSMSIRELKSGLGRRRMSKPQLIKIKQDTQNKREMRVRNLKMKTELFKQSNISYKRAFSEANFDRSRFQMRQAINVINPQLRRSMLIRLEDYEQFLVIEKEFPVEFQDCLAKDDHEDEVSVTSYQKGQMVSQADLQASRIAPFLPPIERQPFHSGLNQQDLILSKLQQSIRSKSRL